LEAVNLSQTQKETLHSESLLSGYRTPSNIKQLFTHRVGILANLLSRLAALENNRRFGLSMLDWRIIGLVGLTAPMSLNQLAREANLEKSQASRAVAKLIENGYINRGADKTDGRGVQLVLTQKGGQLYKKMLSASIDRCEAILQVLSDRERKALEATIDKLTRHAIELLSEEKTLQR